jgi:Sodium:solute symporter family
VINITTIIMATYILFCLSVLGTAVAEQQCLSDPVLNEFFQVDEPTCCMKDVCGLPCPEPVSDPSVGYAVAIAAAIGVSFLIGVATLLLVNETEDFFVAGRSLPLWIVAFTLGAQSIDSNALLGNADLAYKYSFWDGAVLPIGLGLSLIINGCTLAPKINCDFDGVLTLPDIYAKRYGRLVEILVSCATLISFMMLLAGNLVVSEFGFQFETFRRCFLKGALTFFFSRAWELSSVTFGASPQKPEFGLLP